VWKDLHGFWNVTRKADAHTEPFASLEAALQHLIDLPPLPKRPELRLVKTNECP
jgi:hypothetical protein